MTGKLKFENNKWKISFQNEKNETKTLFCQPNVFSQGFNPSKEEETEIDFERDNTPQKNACKVRPKGQEWQGKERVQTVDYNRQNRVRQNQRRDDRNQRNTQNQPGNNSIQSLNGEFHNPYNFIPAVPREKIGNGLDDDKPIGHDKFHTGYYTGRLTVTMTVETPLVVLDTARVEVQAEHKKFPVRVENGKPYINPTAVKGMLRSAFEAVTNSRLSVFAKHDDKLAFRMNPKEALDFLPVRIEGNSSGQKQITFYTGKFDESMPAAWLGKYGTHNSGNYNNLDIHRKEVWAYIEVWEHLIDKRRPFRNDNVFYFWNVVELQDINVVSPNLIQQNRRANWNNARRLAAPQGQWVRGFVCNTKQNIRGKHDERVFFKDVNAPTPEILDEAKWNSLKDKWRNLIENYQEEHTKEDRPPQHSGANSWSRQIKGGKNETKLETGTLCYAKVQESGGKFEVLELYPVMISRRLHKVSPAALLDDSLKPASIIEEIKNQDGTIKHKSEMSPADRVFGFVRQKRKDKNGKDIPFKGKVAGYRGQIRIGSVTTKSTDAIQDFNDLPLNILGQPKPQQGRFYVAETPRGEAQQSQQNNEGAGYKTGRGLRGRKVYPHHAHIEGEEFWFQSPTANFDEQGNYWSEEFPNSKGKKYFREYLRPKGLNTQTNQIEQQRDSQNRSIQGWVRPKTVFEFEIHFTNLSKVELGALIWLLDMDRYANGEGENHKYFHRFGGGKPLGFGSVSLSLKDSGCEIYEGKELEKRYKSLDDVSIDKTEAKTCQAEFEKVANQDILKSFKVTCKGFDDRLPIHYPRARRFSERNGVKTWLTAQSPQPLPPHSEGLAYEWFVENNKNGKQYTLPNIDKDDGLPIFDHKKTGG